MAEPDEAAADVNSLAESDETAAAVVGTDDDVPPTIKEASSFAGLHRLLKKMTEEVFTLGKDLSHGDNMTELTSAVECEESDHEDDVKIDSEFGQCAKNALVKLQAIDRLLKQLHKAPLLTDSDSRAVEKVLRQLTDNEVYLCVLGRYNIGKTTLINALLYADILPTSRDAETAVTVYIQHDRELEGHNIWLQSSSDLKGPCLTKLLDSGEDPIYGMQNIKTYLKDVHKAVRKGELTKTDYRLKTSIPVFAALPEGCVITPYLVDTAGSNEAGQTELQHMAQVNRRTAAVYIYVMSYSQLRNEQDYEAFSDIFQRDESIFEDGRMMIVITHFDMSYNHGEELTEKEVKTTVIRELNRFMPEVAVSEEIIVLISGLWAYESRVCKGTEGGSLATSCRHSLISLHRQSDDQVLLKSIFELSTDSMCSKLVDASGIEVLEARLREMVQHLFYMWKAKIIVSCQGMLQAAIGTLSEVHENTHQSLTEAFERSKHFRDVERLHTQLLKIIDEDSPVLSTFGEKYTKDTQIGSKFTSMVDLTISGFMKNLESKVKRRNYTPENLRQDINETNFRKEVELKMKNIYSQTKFDACQDYLRKQLVKFSDKFGRLKLSAVQLYEHERARSLSTIHDEDEDVTETIDEIVEQTNKELGELDIPEVAYGLKEKIKILFDKLLFGSLKVRIIRPEHLQSVKETITASLHEHQREFFEDIKEPVILYFFKIFCQQITDDLTEFHKLVEVYGQKVMESLNAIKREQQQIEQMASQYEEWKTQLQELKDLVETYARHNDLYKNAAC